MVRAQAGSSRSRGHTRVTDPATAHAACPVTRDVLNRVGDKWSVLVIVVLGGGSRRFSELKRLIAGISQRMLTHTLRGLERDGIVTRTVLPTVPPRVDYALTPLGRTLLETLSALARWASENHDAIDRARSEFDRREARTARLAEPA